MKTVNSIIVILCGICVSFGGDQWITTGQDQMYPQALYVVGVGLSEKSLDAAKQSAMVEVKKQLSVSVNSSVLDEQMSMFAGGSEKTSGRVESRSRLSTSGNVEGIEIVKTANQGKIFYALAALDKKNYETNVRAKIAELKKELTALIDGVRADLSGTAIRSALLKLADAKKIISRILEQRKFLSAVAEITDAEALPYTATDIALLYDKCVSSLKLAKTGGDNQTFAVGMVPADPFSVAVTAQGSPAPGIPVCLLNDAKKTVLTAYTGDDGKADLILGEQADVSAGKHSYTAVISLNVSSALKSQLAAQNQSFTYTVTSNPCFARIVVETDPALSSGKDEIAKKVLTRLSKYDLKDDPNSGNTLAVTVFAKETGGVTGLSENASFIKTDVTITLSLKGDDGKELASIAAAAKGTGGSFVKSAAQGVENAKIEKDLKPLLDKMCNAASRGPKLRIAVFDFKEHGTGTGSAWYETAQKLSDMIITRLINSGRVDVVERMQLNRILEEKSFAQSGIVEEKEAMAAAKIAGADIVLLGSANIVGDKVEADCRVVDMKSGVAKCATSTSSFSVSDLRAMADELVSRIKGPCLKQD